MYTIEQLRQKEISGEPLTSEEWEQLTAYYTAHDTKEIMQLTPALTLIQLRQEQQIKQISRLETFYQEKQARLHQIYTLIAEIEAIEQEETKLLSRVER